MARAQTALEERWNVATHAIGIALFFLVALYIFISSELTSAAVVGCTVYFFSQVFLYTASTSYHFVRPGKIKFRLRKLDHVSIYFSIAGTYTPVCLISLADSNGYLILTAVWGIALFGTVWKFFFTGKFEAFSSLLYLVMGWLVVLDLDNLMAAFTDYQLNMLILGGIFFTVGIVFYAWQKLYFNHVIWHLFVLGGSISHLFMVISLL